MVIRHTDVSCKLDAETAKNKIIWDIGVMYK